jgi:tRNA (pseudouridine54-N1)-methyltransferase
MREFILLAHKAKTSPDFNIDDLPHEGRLDLVCRTVSNAIWVSNEIRRDTIIHVVMNGPPYPPKIVSFNGAELKGAEPDERTIAKLIKNALKEGLKFELSDEKEVSPGIKVSKKSFEALAKEKSGSSQLLYLERGGEDIRKFNFKENIVFVLGDYIGLPKKTERLLDRLGAKNINIGPITLFASHCPIIVHNELDRRQFGQRRG